MNTVIHLHVSVMCDEMNPSCILVHVVANSQSEWREIRAQNSMLQEVTER